MKKTFENYDLKFNNQSKEIELIKSFPGSEYKTLVISGNVGIGKTHLVKALEKVYGSRRAGEYDSRMIKNAIFIKADILYYIFMQANFPTLEFRTDIKYDFYDLKKVHCLIIDDIGSEIEDKKGYFKLCIKELLEDRQGQLVITTNYGWERLVEIYGEKIYSRMCENMMWVDLKGKD